ncbi:MAG: 30S ribosomal protein S5 [Parcubacteria group bacterium]|nr:30S ribosomal protein S5 [Parcubacteria group bacterium]
MEGRNRRRDDEFDQKVLDVARVTRVTKGGKRFTFRATVVLGDHKNRVGVGTGRGADVAQAIEKASRLAKKNAITVLLKKGTISHLVEAKYASARVLLKPAMPGSGVKAGGPVRIISKLAGIQDITSKLISRTNNKINIAQAVIQALKQLKNLEIRK